MQSSIKKMMEHNSIWVKVHFILLNCFTWSGLLSGVFGVFGESMSGHLLGK